jgi:hypothetical protein
MKPCVSMPSVRQEFAMSRVRRNAPRLDEGFSSDHESVSRQDLKRLLRHHGQEGAVSRLWMANFLRKHSLPIQTYLAVARAAGEHPRRRGAPVRRLQMPDGRRAIIDHNKARIERIGL